MKTGQPGSSRWQGLMLRARGFLSAGRFFLLISSAFLVAFGILFSFYYEEGRSLLSLAIAPVPRQAFLPHQLFSSTAALPFVLSDTARPRQLSSRNTSGDEVDSNKNTDGKSGSKGGHRSQNGRSALSSHSGLPPPPGSHGGAGRPRSPSPPLSQFAGGAFTPPPPRPEGGGGGGRAAGKQPQSTGGGDMAGGEGKGRRDFAAGSPSSHNNSTKVERPQPVRWLGGENPLRPAMCRRLNAQKRVAKQFVLLALLFIDFRFDEKSLASTPLTPRSAGGGGMAASPRGEDRWSIADRVRFTDANRVLNRLIAEAHASGQVQENNVLPRFLWQNEAPCRMAAVTGKQLPLIAIRLFDLLKEARSSSTTGLTQPLSPENRGGGGGAPPLILSEPPKRKERRSGGSAVSSGDSEKKKGEENEGPRDGPEEEADPSGRMLKGLRQEEGRGEGGGEGGGLPYEKSGGPLENNGQNQNKTLQPKAGEGGAGDGRRSSSLSPPTDKNVANLFPTVSSDGGGDTPGTVGRGGGNGRSFSSPDGKTGGGGGEGNSESGAKGWDSRRNATGERRRGDFDSETTRTSLPGKDSPPERDQTPPKGRELGEKESDASFQEGGGQSREEKDGGGAGDEGAQQGGRKEVRSASEAGSVATHGGTEKNGETTSPASSRGAEKLLVEDGEVAFHYFVLQLMKEDPVDQPPVWDTAQIQRIAKNSRISTRPNASLHELINHAASVWSSYLIIEELQRGFVVERMVEDWIGPIVGKMTGRYHDALATVAGSFREPIMDEPLCGRMYLLLDGFRTSPIASIFYENTITAQQLNHFRDQLLSHIEAEMEKAVQQLADELRLGLKTREPSRAEGGVGASSYFFSSPLVDKGRTLRTSGSREAADGLREDGPGTEGYDQPSEKRPRSSQYSSSSSSASPDSSVDGAGGGRGGDSRDGESNSHSGHHDEGLGQGDGSSDFHPVTRRQLPITRLAGYIVRLGSGTFHAGVVGEGNTFAGNQRLLDTMTDDSLLAEIQLFDEASLSLQGDDVPPLPTLISTGRSTSSPERAAGGGGGGGGGGENGRKKEESSPNGSSSSGGTGSNHTDSSSSSSSSSSTSPSSTSSGGSSKISSAVPHSSKSPSSSRKASSPSSTPRGEGFNSGSPPGSNSGSAATKSFAAGEQREDEELSGSIHSLSSVDPSPQQSFSGDWVSGSNPDAPVPVITAMQALKRHINSAGGSRSIWFFKRSLVVYSSLEGVDLPDPLGGHLGLPPSTDYDIHFFVYVPMSDYSSNVGEKLRKAFLRMVLTNTGGPRTWALNGEEPLVEDSRISELGTAKLTDEGQALKLKTFGIELDDNQRTNVQKLIQRDLVLIHYKIKGLATMRGQLIPGEEWRVMRAERMFARILKQCRNILDVPYAAVIKRQSVTEQRQVKKMSEIEGGLPVWVLALAVLCTAVPLITFMFCLQFHKRLPVPWWISCICSSSPPWETSGEDPPGDDDGEVASLGNSDCMAGHHPPNVGLPEDAVARSRLGQCAVEGGRAGVRANSGSDGGKAAEVTSQGSTTHAGGGGSVLDGGGGGGPSSPVGMMSTAASHSRPTAAAGGWHDASTRWLNNSSVCSDHMSNRLDAISGGSGSGSFGARSGSGGDWGVGAIHHPVGVGSTTGGGSGGSSSPQRQGSHPTDMPPGPSAISNPLRKKTPFGNRNEVDDFDHPVEGGGLPVWSTSE